MFLSNFCSDVVIHIVVSSSCCPYISSYILQLLLLLQLWWRLSTDACFALYPEAWVGGCMDKCAGFSCVGDLSWLPLALCACGSFSCCHLSCVGVPINTCCWCSLGDLPVDRNIAPRWSSGQGKKREREREKREKKVKLDPNQLKQIEEIAFIIRYTFMQKLKK